MKFPVIYVLIFATAASLLSCSGNSQTKSFMDQLIIVKSEETVQVKGAGLKITNNGCGREWGEFGERVYYRIQVRKGDSTWQMPAHSDPLYIEDLQLTVDKANPWGREEDSVPPGGCRISIRRSPAFVLLEKYGWTPKKLLNQSEFELPEKLTGIPFYHYANATGAIGYDLDQLAGSKVTVLKIQLTETGKHSGHHVWAHIVMDGNEALTGWLSSQDMAPGIAPLNLDKTQLARW